MNLHHIELQNKVTSATALGILATASLACLAWPGLVGAQSSRHHHHPLPQPQTNATTVSTPTQTVTSGGTWQPLPNLAPEGFGPMMLLSDGTVAANGYSDNTWYRLSPDSKGAYRNGAWSQLASMNYQRLYFQSDILPSGKIFVSGGEYGNAPAGSTETYDPVANTWTERESATTVYPDMNFVDGSSMVLPNGSVLAYSVEGTECIDHNLGIYVGAMLTYHTASGTWSKAGCPIGDLDETSWVKLPDNSILALDLYSRTSERYIPSIKKWIADAPPPVNLFNQNGELGGGFLLPNGKVFYIGGTSQTLIYTPSGNTHPGTWVEGPSFPMKAGVAIGANDAPAAMMADGKVLLAADPYACGYCGPTYFFVYDYRSNTLTEIAAPGGGTSLPGVAYVMGMLDLPDGSVLFSQDDSQLYTFRPAGKQVEAGEPRVHRASRNRDGSYHVTGAGFNGISAGTNYGDENQNSTNYPIARLTDFKGDVYFARTFNWSSTGVATGNLEVSTEMALPEGLPHGIYLLTISANGISSDESWESRIYYF